MKTILVPVDFSDVTAAVVETAKKIAIAFKSRLVLLHVVENEPGPVELMPGFSPLDPVNTGVLPPVDLELIQGRLEKIKEKLCEPSLEVACLVGEGGTLRNILDTCKQENADLIVLGSHGHGALYNLLAGSIASGVLRSAEKPVLVVPSPRSRKA